MPRRILLSNLRTLFRSSPARRRPIPTRASRTRKHLLELLEDRCLLSTYSVTNTEYSGTGSLGAAITAAVAVHDSAAVITFSGVPANSTIQLNSGDVSSAAAEFGPTAFFITGSGTKITIEGSGAPGLVINGGNAVRPFVVAGGDCADARKPDAGRRHAPRAAPATAPSAAAAAAAAGLGGAVLNEGVFSAEGCTFVNNSAQGGSGGNAQPGSDPANSGGGGGGLGSTSPGNGDKGADVNGGAHNKDGGFGGGGGAGGFSIGGNFTTGPGGSGGFGGGGGGGGTGVSWPMSFALVDYGGGNGGNGGFGGGGGGAGFNPLSPTNGLYPGHGGFGGGGGIEGGGSFNGAGGGGAGMGGGIFSNGGTLTLTNDSFNGNTAAGGAGGQVVTSQSPTSIFAGGGSGYGGAVFLLNGSLNATSDTFRGNTASGAAGGESGNTARGAKRAKASTSSAMAATKRRAQPSPTASSSRVPRRPSATSTRAPSMAPPRRA